MKQFILEPTNVGAFTGLTFEAQYSVLYEDGRRMNFDPQEDTIFRGESGCWVGYFEHKPEDFRILTSAQVRSALNGAIRLFPVQITEITMFTNNHEKNQVIKSSE